VRTRLQTESLNARDHLDLDVDGKVLTEQDVRLWKNSSFSG
jgi:hypothetical protein